MVDPKRNDDAITQMLMVEGLSYTQAAARLGVTKGVVAGRAKTWTYQNATQMSTATRRYMETVPNFKSVPVVHQRSAGWDEQLVGNDSCTWPEGCTAKALKNYPYCAEHCSVCLHERERA